MQLLSSVYSKSVLRSYVFQKHNVLGVAVVSGRLGRLLLLSSAMSLVASLVTLFSDLGSRRRNLSQVQIRSGLRAHRLPSVSTSARRARGVWRKAMNRRLNVIPAENDPAEG